MDYKLIIAATRKQQGIKQCVLAEKVGISQSYLSDIEQNKHDIKLSLLVRIAVALNVHPRELYEK